MTHISGQQDADLHHEDGSHRSTPPTADGRALESHERRLLRHLDAHQVENENVEAYLEDRALDEEEQ